MGLKILSTKPSSFQFGFQFASDFENHGRSAMLGAQGSFINDYTAITMKDHKIGAGTAFDGVEIRVD